MMNYRSVQSTYSKLRNQALPEDISGVTAKVSPKGVKKLVSGHVLASLPDTIMSPIEFRDVVGTMVNVIRKADLNSVEYDFDRLAEHWGSVMKSQSMTDEIAVETFGLVKFLARKSARISPVTADAVCHAPFWERLKEMPRALYDQPAGGFVPNVGVVAGYIDFLGDSLKAKQVAALLRSLAAFVVGEVFLLTTNKQPDSVVEFLLEAGVTCVWVKPNLDKPQSLDETWAAHRHACEVHKISITLFTNTHGLSLYMAHRCLTPRQVICLWFGDNLFQFRPPFDFVMIMPTISNSDISYDETVVDYGDMLNSAPKVN